MFFNLLWFEGHHMKNDSQNKWQSPESSPFPGGNSYLKQQKYLWKTKNLPYESKLVKEKNCDVLKLLSVKQEKIKAIKLAEEDLESHKGIFNFWSLKTDPCDTKAEENLYFFSIFLIQLFNTKYLYLLLFLKKKLKYFSKKWKDSV